MINSRLRRWRSWHSAASAVSRCAAPDSATACGRDSRWLLDATVSMRPVALTVRNGRNICWPAVSNTMPPTRSPLPVICQTPRRELCGRNESRWVDPKTCAGFDQQKSAQGVRVPRGIPYMRGSFEPSRANRCCEYHPRADIGEPRQNRRPDLLFRQSQSSLDAIGAGGKCRARVGRNRSDSN